jgi:hypothetical protein
MRDYPPPRPVDPADVARIIRLNPERHYQGGWITNPSSVRETLVEEARPYASRPYPALPKDPRHPVCQTRACVGGWAAILGAPDGTLITFGGGLEFPDGSRAAVSSYARDAMGITIDAAILLFDGNNTRNQVLEALDELALDRDADISWIFIED